MGLYSDVNNGHDMTSAVNFMGRLSTQAKVIAKKRENSSFKQ